MTLGGFSEGSPILVTMVTSDLVERGLNAGNIARDAAKLMGGGGGGRPEMAQAGGRQPDKLEDALAAVSQSRAGSAVLTDNLWPRYPLGSRAADADDMKLLALDVGDRRIGLASGVSELGTALPAGVLHRSRLALDIRGVVDAARQRQTDVIVVGVPYLPGGEESPQTKLVRGFVRALRKETGLPVHTVDEAFTSVEAEALLRDAGQEPSPGPWVGGRGRLRC